LLRINSDAQKKSRQRNHKLTEQQAIELNLQRYDQLLVIWKFFLYQYTAGFLTYRSSYTFPFPALRPVVIFRYRMYTPGLQWRDRAGLPPASLL